MAKPVKPRLPTLPFLLFAIAFVNPAYGEHVFL